MLNTLTSSCSLLTTSEHRHLEHTNLSFVPNNMKEKLRTHPYPEKQLFSPKDTSRANQLYTHTALLYIPKQLYFNDRVSSHMIFHIKKVINFQGFQERHVS